MEVFSLEQAWDLLGSEEWSLEALERQYKAKMLVAKERLKLAEEARDRLWDSVPSDRNAWKSFHREQAARTAEELSLSLEALRTLHMAYMALKEELNQQQSSYGLSETDIIKTTFPSDPQLVDVESSTKKRGFGCLNLLAYFLR